MYPNLEVDGYIPSSTGKSDGRRGLFARRGGKQV